MGLQDDLNKTTGPEISPYPSGVSLRADQWGYMQINPEIEARLMRIEYMLEVLWSQQLYWQPAPLEYFKEKLSK